MLKFFYSNYEFRFVLTFRCLYIEKTIDKTTQPQTIKIPVVNNQFPVSNVTSFVADKHPKWEDEDVADMVE